MGMLTREEIEKMGFLHVGENPRLSDKASYYNCGNISIGDNVRIDDFSVISAGEGGIRIGNYIHIAVYSLLQGAARITLEDYSGLSSRVSVYSSSDDYSGASMTNPTVPEAFTNVKTKEINIGRHVIIGCGSIVLPGVTLEEGVAVGALSMITKNCHAFGIYSGTPAKRISERKRDLLELEEKLLKGVHL
ncbi:acyltransferase [Pseudomonas moraviensis subsp. stanleyae]|uniref:acyltransferase n=1 Tax=Pseudomonas moraviensis TaxID=321662 RepID=UPI002E2F35DC|nr:acyltransferase [Pseudomonas moraviensis]MED7667586.1 acyltransferase [Pseudomonas moraviensis subsp. stanleyae]